MTDDAFFQLGLLFAEVLATAYVFVLVFRARRTLGYVPLYVTVGAFQFVQTLLSLSVYVPFTDTVQISPGSAVMLPATVFAVLLVYIAEDAPEARKLIYSVVIANVAVSILTMLFGGHLGRDGAVNVVDLPPEVFQFQPRVMVIGTIAMFADVLLVIVFYEAVSKVVRSTYLRLLLSTLGALWLDTLIFVAGSFGTTPEFYPILLSGIIGKSASAAVYAAVFTVFVVRRGLHEEEDGPEIADVFRSLTYRQRYEQVKELALRDPLTNLYNRRYFHEALDREIEHSLRYDTPLALLLIDVDHFKAVNDSFGHAEGDRALQLVAGAIEKTVRGADIPCRIGGEEFAVVAPTAAEAVAVQLAQRIREDLADTYRSADPPFGMDDLTVTIGVAALTGEETRTGGALPDLLYSAADRRLYLGKHGGRDRIVDSSADAETTFMADVSQEGDPAA